MSKIGNYVVELQELTDSVMELEPFDDFFSIDEIYGCDHCILSPDDDGFILIHKSDCPVIKLREVLTKQGSK
jgi:hypothetical protein